MNRDTQPAMHIEVTVPIFRLPQVSATQSRTAEEAAQEEVRLTLRPVERLNEQAQQTAQWDEKQSFNTARRPFVLFTFKNILSAGYIAVIQVLRSAGAAQGERQTREGDSQLGSERLFLMLDTATEREKRQPRPGIQTIYIHSSTEGTSVRCSIDGAEER